MNRTLARAAAAFALAGLASTQTSLIFSEYIEGNGNNKALEIFNATFSTVDLSTVVVALYNNGAVTPNATVTLSGSLPSAATYVIAHSSASVSFLTAANPNLTINGGVVGFNGDDAVALRVGGVVVDVIGTIGVDPGSEWTANGVSTLNSTLRRMISVCGGDSTGFTDPSQEWTAFPIDTASGLGAHTSNCATPIIVCAGANNSTGSPATISANGSPIVASNNITLAIAGLPTAGTTAMIFNSKVTTPVTIPNPAAGGTAGVPSDGNICIGGGTFGRHFRDIYIGTSGTFNLALDLTDIPYPTAANNYSAAVLAGETWYFQCWYRDAFLGPGRSNFSGAIGITFQ